MLLDAGEEAVSGSVLRVCRCGEGVGPGTLHALDCPLGPAQREREVKPMTHRSGTCAKCGSGDVSLIYCCSGYHGSTSNQRKDEHLDYACRSCGFEWEGDCMDAKVEAADEAMAGP